MDTDIMRRLERILEDARAVNAVLGDWDKIIDDARKAMDLMRAAKVDLDAANELLAGVATRRRRSIVSGGVQSRSDHVLIGGAEADFVDLRSGIRYRQTPKCARLA